MTEWCVVNVIYTTNNSLILSNGAMTVFAHAPAIPPILLKYSRIACDESEYQR